MQTRTRLIGAIAAVACGAGAPLLAKNVTEPAAKVTRVIETGSPTSLDIGLIPGRASATVTHATATPETTVLAEYDFDGAGSCDPQGWTGVDFTAQEGTFFHVDDFAGLGGGTFGRLVAPEGNQAMWCGARPDPEDPVFCRYNTLPGYGNGWDQWLITKACLSVDTLASVDYLATWDGEPGYDAVTVKVDRCDEVWVNIGGGIGVFDWPGSGFVSNAVPANMSPGPLRVRFHFTSDGAWSDWDGLWDTDGAFIVDSLCVRDAGGLVLPVETFEDESPGDLISNDWEAKAFAGYGDFSGLFPGVTLVQEDPCVSNITCVWGFFNGSTYDYGCGGFPFQEAVPYVNETGTYISNAVYSPLIPLVGSGGGINVEFDVYRDLPLDPLVFYNNYTRVWVDGCPLGWQRRSSVYWGDGKKWLTAVRPVGDLVDVPGATHMQIALTCQDWCGSWCGIFGTGACHTHAPLFDNVRVYRINTTGPYWTVRSLDMFQDNFAGDGTVTGTVRVDMAIDIAPEASVNKILPGDSAVVNVGDVEYGLAGDPHTGTGPAVYAYVTVWPDGSKFGPDIASPEQSNNGYERYPLVDSLQHGGKWWYCVRFDTSFTDGNTRLGAQDDRFAVDLNDHVFTSGDTVCFVFAATNAAPVPVTTYYSEFTGTTGDLAEALDSPMEFTCLPAGGWLRGGDILYVDAADGRGAQPYIDDALDALGLLEQVDRFDERGPTSSLANGLGSRVKNVEQQLLACYRKIIWSTGDVPVGTIGDGTGNPEKSDDASVLFAFLDGLDEPGGLYITGGDVADELAALSGAGAVNLRSKFINYVLVSGSQVGAGLGVTPTVVGEAGSCFYHSGVPDIMVAYGGCPAINDFDVIAPAGTATLEASYNGAGAGSGAIVGQQTLNTDGTAVGVLLSGFSFHEIRDDEATGIADRWEHLDDILAWLGNDVADPIPVRPGRSRNYLAQNTPNPFNPTTTIRFELRERSRVQLRIYNIAGQLVRMIVDEARAPGEVHVIEWDGTNTHGEVVSSGVYFCKLTAPAFTQTRKMVLLK